MSDVDELGAEVALALVSNVVGEDPAPFVRDNGRTGAEVVIVALVDGGVVERMLVSGCMVVSVEEIEDELVGEVCSVDVEEPATGVLVRLPPVPPEVVDP